jgi:hypothetical protein
MPRQWASHCFASQVQAVEIAATGTNPEWSAARFLGKLRMLWAAETAIIVSQPHGALFWGPDDLSDTGR